MSRKKRKGEKAEISEEEKLAKEFSSHAGKKRMDISILAVIDNIVFSKKEIWAYYRVENSVFDFLSTDAQNSLAIRTSNAFNSIMTERNEEVDGHLIITSTPVDIDSWEEQVKESSKNWDKAKNFDEFLNKEIRFLKEQGFTRKVSYLGIKLGNRGALESESLNILQAGLRGTLDFVKEWGKRALQVPSEQIDAFEEEEARRKEKSLHTILSTGNLQASRVSAEEILLLIKRQFYPSLPAPYLDVDHGDRLGPGDLVLETSSVIRNKYRFLEIEQLLGSQVFRGYRAAISFSEFPKFMSYPNGTVPFFYLTSKMGLPFTLYSRFTLIPSQSMKKEVEKKKKETTDEIVNLHEGRRAEEAFVNQTPADIEEALADLQTMESILATDKTPWLDGHYRIVLETPTEDMLKKYAAILTQQYADHDINLTWTSGDQADLFLEQMPGDHLRMKSFKQTTNVHLLGTSGFNFSSDIGDRIYGTDVELVGGK